MTAFPKILIVDDERISRENLEYVLKKEGYETRCAVNGAGAMAFLEKETFDVVITDLRMDGHDGFEVLDRVKTVSPATEVIMITGYATVANAVDAMQKGAYSYVAKPFRIDEVRLVVARALEKHHLKKEVSDLRRAVGFKNAPMLLGRSPVMASLKSLIRKVADTDCSVVIQGETGTGKELVARMVHALSGRKDKRFLAFSCGSFDENLLANELFGHEKGAFTGARDTKKGLLESAPGGTLFLDEIADMPMSMQVKLLRVLQERSFMRVGGTAEIPIDIRVIAAANRDLKEEVTAGKFRQDLFFRLNVITITVPPLRDRKDDIPLLCRHFLQEVSSGEESITGISEVAMKRICAYDFPGNIRELENMIARAAALASGSEIQPKDLPADLRSRDEDFTRPISGKFMTLAENETAHILWVLGKVGGNKTRAAEILGIDRVSLWRKMRRYGLDAPWSGNEG